jgi:hypothetical protein
MSATSPVIKRTAIPLSGYVYQNFVGLGLLCDWLDDPALYDWVQFEADHDEVPQGLDDIVAQRRDGTLVLLQVKFTVNAQDPGNALAWNWLLTRKPSYVRRDQAETSVLFELISERYERKSLAITANTPFSQWGEVFVEPAMTLAAVDRLVHHSTILEMNVESYRRRAAQALQASPARKARSAQ